MTGLLLRIGEFAGLVNTALLVSLILIAVRVFRATVTAKDAQVDLLRDRLAAAEEVGVERVRDRFKALKEWYELSVVELERQLAARRERPALAPSIKAELAERTALFQQAARLERSAYPLSPEDVCATYSVVGQNPDDVRLGYVGTLTIRTVGTRLAATWILAGGIQRQEGVGFVQGRYLAFAFRYDNHENPDGAEDHGVVMYEAISDTVMRGRWTGFRTLLAGTEECRRLRAGDPLDPIDFMFTKRAP